MKWTRAGFLWLWTENDWEVENRKTWSGLKQSDYRMIWVWRWNCCCSILLTCVYVCSNAAHKTTATVSAKSSQSFECLSGAFQGAGNYAQDQFFLSPFIALVSWEAILQLQWKYRPILFLFFPYFGYHIFVVVVCLLLFWKSKSVNDVELFFLYLQSQ